MKRGRVVGRMVSSHQAAMLRLAIASYRKVKRLLRDWEVATSFGPKHPQVAGMWRTTAEAIAAA